METIRVLIISDETDDVAQLQRLLKRSPHPDTKYKVDCVDTFHEALRALVNTTHDAYLVDYKVPGSNISGIDLTQRAYAGGCTAPIIILTHLNDGTLHWAAEAAGAADVLHKRADICPHPDCPLNRSLETARRLIDKSIRYSVRHFQQLRNIQKQVDGMQKQLVDLNKKLSR